MKPKDLVPGMLVNWMLFGTPIMLFIIAVHERKRSGRARILCFNYDAITSRSPVLSDLTLIFTDRLEKICAPPCENSNVVMVR